MAGSGGVAFSAAVPGIVAVRAVLVVFAVALVMLGVVGDQVVQGEAVVAGDEVDAVVGGAAVVAIQVRGTGKPPAHFGDVPGVALGETAHGVAEAAVPFGPVDGKVADLIGAGVPGLGDEDGAAEYGVLRGGIEERAGGPKRAVPGAAQHAGEVEAESVDMHLLAPVAQGVHDEADDVRGCRSWKLLPQPV